MMDKFTVIHAEDWEGLYVNGRLALEGHSLDIDDVLDKVNDVLSIQRKGFEVECTGTIMKPGTRLPNKLKDLETTDTW